MSSQLLLQAGSAPSRFRLRRAKGCSAASPPQVAPEPAPKMEIAHFCQVIGLGLAKVKAAATKLNVDEKWLATALAVRYLVKQLGHESDTWELVVEKARAWLEAQPEGGDEKSEVWTVEKLK
ncbi:VIT-domain-containing protein [Venturia nashicola]|uniref:VIT-domain-containing protein n=1 Tax=Venturia nashicola TaxID=86259 RepID=A0A4Z1PLB7_9PEZI|nr:VIT-domain-containing protein [Venturia nashicola]